jgi:hypothetical protein
MQTVSKQKVEAALQIVKAIADAIRELKEVPSGHLYANLMGKLTLQQYEEVIQVLVRAKVITVKNHLITWIGGTE